MQTATATTMPPKIVHVIPAKSEFTEQRSVTTQLNTAAYCRVSTDKDEQHLSYEAQKETYTDKIMRNSEWRLAGIFADKGITGTQATKRPEFMRMIKQCKLKKIDLIITKSVTRFARNTVDALEYARMLKDMGIGIIFEKEGLDTRKMTSEFMLTIYASLAQAESESISGNVKWGKQKSAAKGNVAISYKSFLGYRRGADGQPEIDPEQAVTVRRIYDEFLAGQSLKTIADRLTADGILTAMGKIQWSAQGVKHILLSEKYAGNAVLQKTFVVDCISHRSKKNTGELPSYFIENNHPAIIEQTMWNRVQEELARRGGKRKVKEIGTKTEQGKYSSKFALTELLICGSCGTPYRRVTWSKNGKKKAVWRCISRLDHGTKYCAESPTLEESVLQSAILEAITQMVKENVGIIETIKRHIEMGLTCESDGDDRCVLQTRIGEIDKTISDLILLETQDGNQGKYDEQFESLYTEKMNIKSKLEQLKSDSDHAGANRSRLDEIFTIVDGLKNCQPEWDEKIIRQMIECVKVKNKEWLTVKFRLGMEMDARMV